MAYPAAYVLSVSSTITRATVWCWHTEADTKILMLACSCLVPFVISRVSENSGQVIIHMVLVWSSRLSAGCLQVPCYNSEAYHGNEGYFSRLHLASLPSFPVHVGPSMTPICGALYGLHCPLHAVASSKGIT